MVSFVSFQANVKKCNHTCVPGVPNMGTWGLPPQMFGHDMGKHGPLWLASADTLENLVT